VENEASNDEAVSEIAAATTAARQLEEVNRSDQEGFVEAEKAIGRRIREQRIDSGLSQAELALRLVAHGFDAHQTTVAKIENGARPLRVAELMTFGVALNVPWISLALEPLVPQIGDRDEREYVMQLRENSLRHIEKQMGQTLQGYARQYARAFAELEFYRSTVLQVAADQASDGVTDG
jgi:transcriptional regulator with XRE-family HTH domain